VARDVGVGGGVENVSAETDAHRSVIELFEHAIVTFIAAPAVVAFEHNRHVIGERQRLVAILLARNVDVGRRRVQRLQFGRERGALQCC